MIQPIHFSTTCQQINFYVLLNIMNTNKHDQIEIEFIVYFLVYFGVLCLAIFFAMACVGGK
jgi:hypothetical protein